MESKNQKIKKYDLMEKSLPRSIKVSMLLIFLIILAAGCSQKQGGQGEALLTIEKVVEAFQDSGIQVIEDYAIPGEKVKLNDVRPSVFILEGSNENRLFVYAFKGIADRKAATDNWYEEKDRIYKEYMHKDVPMPFTYQAKNILIINTVKDIEEYLSHGFMLWDIVFEKLNNGKTIVCKGESENWKGTFTLKYYLHQWTDAKGVLRHEGQYRLNEKLEFKGSVYADEKVSFEYEGPGHGGSGTVYLSNDQRIITGSSGGNGYYDTENLVYYVTVKWNGKEEKLVLTGYQKSNTEIQTFCDIPVYPNAALVENDQDKAVFLVESLALSTFKEFYKNNLPVYGWKTIKDGSSTITCERNNQKVIIAYDFPRLPHNEFHDGVINARQPDNPPVFIKIIFSEN
ncbi:MAG: hypothetical protein AAGU27_25250 [Dehalobacterium sp.]